MEAGELEAQEQEQKVLRDMENGRFDSLLPPGGRSLALQHPGHGY